MVGVWFVFTSEWKEKRANTTCRKNTKRSTSTFYGISHIRQRERGRKMRECGTLLSRWLKKKRIPRVVGAELWRWQVAGLTVRQREIQCFFEPNGFGFFLFFVLIVKGHNWRRMEKKQQIRPSETECAWRRAWVGCWRASLSFPSQLKTVVKRNESNGQKKLDDGYDSGTVDALSRSNIGRGKLTRT